MILENKHHICLCAAALTAGILLVDKASVQHIIPAVFLLIGCLTGIYGSKHTLQVRIMIVMIAGSCIFGALWTRYHITTYEKRQAAVQELVAAEVSGVVVRKEIKSDSYLYHIKQTYLKSSKEPEALGHIIISSESDAVPTGAMITATGKIQLFSQARNDGDFDFTDYYRQLNITCRIKADDIRVQDKPRFLLREKMYQLQKNMVQVYTETLNKRDAGILCTLVAGSKSQLDPDTRQMYQEAGISHLLSISGLHISILGFGIYRILRKCRSSYPSAAIISSSVILCFSYMSGFAVPAKRAIVMYLCMMGAQVLGRTYDATHGLALAIIILLIQNPLALKQSGFLFSFTAMLSIILYGILFPAPRWEKKEDSKSKITWQMLLYDKIVSPLKKSCLFNLWLQVWLMPLTAWFYYEVPMYSLFLNLLVLPFSSWLLTGGAIAALIYKWAPGIGGWMLVGCHIILDLYEAGINGIGKIPGNLLLTGKPEIIWMLIYYLFLAVFCCWKWLHPSKKFPCHKILFWVIWGCLLSGTLLVHPGELPGIYMLDVGQGDGLFLTDGAGIHVWIDGGSSSETSVGTYRMLPFLKYHRVAEIDIWIVTHPDEDHVSGLKELLQRGYPIHRLFLAKAQKNQETCQELAALANKNGTDIQYVKAGDQLELTDMNLTCLYPQKEESETDINGLSQVWELHSHGFNMLFTGDLGEAQEDLLDKRGLLHKVNVLKVGHHGSRYSSSETFLANIQPDTALISSSARNRYHHPSAETLKRLENQGCMIYCTKDVGQIAIRYKKNYWYIENFTNSD